MSFDSFFTHTVRASVQSASEKVGAHQDANPPIKEASVEKQGTLCCPDWAAAGGTPSRGQLCAPGHWGLSGAPLRGFSPFRLDLIKSAS